MLARSSIIAHPSGIRIRTPLLVPSFSSKGFNRGISGTPDAHELFLAASHLLAESALISAFDLHHGLVPQPARGAVDLVIVDSGGYETSVIEDLSAVAPGRPSPKEWSQELLAITLRAWPRDIPAVFVSYDTGALRESIPEQVERSLHIFREHPEQLHTLLLKPESFAVENLDAGRIGEVARSFAPFAIIGVTEKELGVTMLDRVAATAAIRMALDAAEIRAPIHVFGCLDPIGIVLHFLAGAEIFDGLSWLRFGFLEGVAVYRQNAIARLGGFDWDDKMAIASLMHQNLAQLTLLAGRLRSFLRLGDIHEFGSIASVVESLAGDLFDSRSLRIL